MTKIVSERFHSELPQENAFLSLQVVVHDEWIDYNAHMTEWQYYKLLSDACENFLRALGFTEEYRRKGNTFFSAEGHLRNLKECRRGTSLNVYTEVLGTDHIRLHLYQYIVDVGRGITVATGEHMLIHVDTTTRRANPVGPYMSECLKRAISTWNAPIKPRGMSSMVRVI